MSHLATSTPAPYTIPGSHVRVYSTASAVNPLPRLALHSTVNIALADQLPMGPFLRITKRIRPPQKMYTLSPGRLESGREPDSLARSGSALKTWFLPRLRRIRSAKMAGIEVFIAKILEGEFDTILYKGTFPSR
jgi:hypothetical protein